MNKAKFLLKLIKSMLILSFILSVDFIMASTSTETIGDVAENISTTTFLPAVRLMIGIGFVSGIGFFIAAVFKLKQVKDNPTQVPVSTPFAFLIVGTLLVYLPTFFGYTADTVFGSSTARGDLADQIKKITSQKKEDQLD